MNRFIFTLALLCSAAASATTVYKTVNDKGVVSFSDTPAEGEEQGEVLKIATPPPQSGKDQAESLEAMRETTDRMAADRREREKHRAELKEIATQSQSAPQPVYNEGATVVSGGYYYPGGRPPWRPGNPAIPERPIVRPPLRNDASVFRGANSQLMRPILGSGR